MPETSQPTFSFLQRAWVMIDRDLRMTAQRRRTYTMRAVFAGSLVLTMLLTWWGHVARPTFGWVALTLLKLPLVALCGLALANLGKLGNRGRALRWRVCFVIVLAVLVGWLGSGAGELSLDQMADLGLSFFLGLSIVAALFVAFLAPAFTAGMIAQEKERNTLGLLLTTQLGGPAIVLGKAAGSLISLYALIAAGLPLLAACMLFGGVGPLHVLVMGLNLFAIASFCASVGFLCSVVCDRTNQAIAASYSLLTLHAFFTPSVLRSLTGNAAFYEMSAYLDPAVGLILFLDGIRGIWNPGGMLAPSAGLRSIPFCAIASLLCLAASVLLFPVFATREPVNLSRRIHLGLDRFFAMLNRGLWRLDFRSEILDGNPVAWKERNYRLLGKTDHTIRAAYFLGAPLVVAEVIMIVQYPGMWFGQEYHTLVLCLLVLLLFVWMSVAASSSVAAEKDRSCWGLVLATSLSGADILSGKLRGSIRSCTIFLGLLVVHLAILCGAGKLNVSAACGILFVVAGVAASQLVAGTYFSIKSRNPIQALVFTIGVGLCVHAVVPAISATISSDSGALYMSPMIGICRIAEWGEGWDWLRVETGITVCASLAYLLFSLTWLTWLYARFDRLVGRSPSY